MPVESSVYSWYQAGMGHDIPVFSVDVQNFALVNFAVPAERVEAVLPPAYELETFDRAGERIAFVSSTCFCNQRFRPVGIGFPHLTFDESTYRTYVTHKGRRGVYFFGRYLSRLPATLPQRIVARDTWQGDFQVATDRTSEGYRSYSCHISSGNGESSFVVEAMDRPRSTEHFATGDEHAQYFTYRLHGFYTSTLGLEGHMPVSHPRMTPWSGELSAAKTDLWVELGILDADEQQDPYSILIEPGVRFTLYAPRPLV